MKENKEETIVELEPGNQRRERNRQSTQFSNEHNNPCSKVGLLQN